MLRTNPQRWHHLTVDCRLLGILVSAPRCRRARLHCRRVVAQAVADDPFTYNEGFLGKANEGYQKWIVDPKRWGGAIELSIFAR